MNINDIAILNLKGFCYRCIIIGISKNKAINLMPNVDLTERSRNYQTFYKKFIIAYKNG